MFTSCLNSLKREIHIPSYSYLGPGTRVEERLKRGDKPKNLLDEAALHHDLFYLHHKDVSQRHIADKILEEKAWKRITSSDADLSERGVALLTAAAMRAKRKLGLGLLSASVSSRKKKKTQKKKTSSKKAPRRRQGGGRGGKPLSFTHVVKKAQ